MNGSNSNTNGSQVANIGFWPRAVLPAIQNALNVVIGSVKGLIDREYLNATVDFASTGGSDKLSDAVMGEITRRLIVTVEKQEIGNIIYSPTAPDDHTKAWWQTDPVTGLTIGRLKTWDEATGEWVDADLSGGQYVAPETRFALVSVAAGSSTVNVSFADIHTVDYRVVLSPTTSVGDGSYSAAPASFPANYGYAIINKTNTTLSVAFYGIPTEGLRFEVDITDRQTTA